MISRPLYIKQLEPFIDKPQVKILTGIRRSGKSTILQLLKDELVNSGIESEQILTMNFESFIFEDFKTAKRLYQYVKTKIETNRTYYLLLDEIQEVDQWEKGSNENLNGLIRQYFSKKTDFSTVSECMQETENKLNSRPRKRYNFDAPTQRMEDLLFNQDNVAFVT